MIEMTTAQKIAAHEANLATNRMTLDQLAKDHRATVERVEMRRWIAADVKALADLRSSLRAEVAA